MASIHGDWFHIRSSSNHGELLAVRNLLLEGEKSKYSGLHWSGDRYSNPLVRKFAEVVGVEPSTMQTKIRAMIRYGFIQDSSVCPLRWTRIGSLWNELYTVGNLVAAEQVYELTLSLSLAIYAFNNSKKQYATNPANGELPLKFLLNSLDRNGAIPMHKFAGLVDGNTGRTGRNESYWKKDLINSGLFRVSSDHLVYTKKYTGLVNDIQNFTPDVSLTNEDWKKIRENPLIRISPFKDSVKNIFEKVTQEEVTEELILDELYTDPLVAVVSEQEEVVLPELDILSENSRFANNISRIRNTTWSIRIKKKYSYTCAVPKCDVTGKIFVESAHIKPNSVNNQGTPHRSHILNGICLCRHCHVAFDRGYFTLTDDHRILTSHRFEDIANQNLKTAIMSSSNMMIKNRIDNRNPLLEFVRYHRTNKFIE